MPTKSLDDIFSPAAVTTRRSLDDIFGASEKRESLDSIFGKTSAPRDISVGDVSDLAKQEAARNAPVGQKLWEGITGSAASKGVVGTAQGGLQALQGAFEVAGAATPESVGGMKDATAGERLFQATQGGQDIISGGLQATTAVPGEAISGLVPGAKYGFEKLGEGIETTSDNFTRNLGFDPSTKEGALMKQSVSNFLNLAAFYATGKAVESAPVKGFTQGIKGEVPEVGPLTKSQQFGTAVRELPGKVAETGKGVVQSIQDKVTARAVEKTAVKDANIIANRTAELYKIENNYANLRKANEYSKDQNAATRERVASTDVLADAVNTDGLIKTKGKGGPVEQYKAQTIDGAENVVRNNLERLGEKVKLDVVEKVLMDNVNKSGLEGADLVSALKSVKKEIDGYRLKADADGTVPLTLIHDAKISTTKGINYQTPPEKATYRKSVARGLKEVVEKNSSFNVGEVNAEIGKYLQDIKYLESLDGKRVKGGKLGKYFAQTAGNVVGAVAGTLVGGPIGTAIGAVAGGELASGIKGSSMAKTLGGKTGRVAPRSPIIEEAVVKGKSPRLMLPAPKAGTPRSQMPSGPTINLPRRSQSTIDNQ